MPDSIQSDQCVYFYLSNPNESLYKQHITERLPVVLVRLIQLKHVELIHILVFSSVCGHIENVNTSMSLHDDWRIFVMLHAG